MEGTGFVEIDLLFLAGFRDQGTGGTATDALTASKSAHAICQSIGRETPDKEQLRQLERLTGVNNLLSSGSMSKGTKVIVV